MAAPTDVELDTFILARLALIGIDLGQLPTVFDPATGSPTRDSALSSLRSFVRTTVPAISGWTSDPDPAQAQQVGVPDLYPSITTAWTAQ